MILGGCNGKQNKEFRKVFKDLGFEIEMDLKEGGFFYVTYHLTKKYAKKELSDFFYCQR